MNDVNAMADYRLYRGGLKYKDRGNEVYTSGDLNLYRQGINSLFRSAERTFSTAERLFSIAEQTFRIEEQTTKAISLYIYNGLH